MPKHVKSRPEKDSPRAPSDHEEDGSNFSQDHELAHQIEEAMVDIGPTETQDSQEGEEGDVENTALPLRNTHVEEECHVRGNTLADTSSRGLTNNRGNTLLDNPSYDDVTDLRHGRVVGNTATLSSDMEHGKVVGNTTTLPNGTGYGGTMGNTVVPPTTMKSLEQ